MAAVTKWVPSSGGTLQPNTTYSVTANGAPVTLYDSTGTINEGSSFTTDALGMTAVYVPAGTYRLVAQTHTTTITVGSVTPADEALVTDGAGGFQLQSLVGTGLHPIGGLPNAHHNQRHSDEDHLGANSVSVAKAGTVLSTRAVINLIAGAGITLTVVDNPALETVDVTISLT